MSVLGWILTGLAVVIAVAVFACLVAGSRADDERERERGRDGMHS